MAIKDALKVTRKTFINPTGWLGYDELKRNTQTTWGNIKEAVTPEKPSRKETFEQAMQRLNLTEKDVEQMQATYTLYSFAFIIFTLCAVAGAFYYLFHFHTVIGFFLALAAASLCGVQVFRFNFWAFQIKHRKLGCTISEWRSGKITDSAGPTNE